MIMYYDYRQAVYDDVMIYCHENAVTVSMLGREEAEQFLNDTLWIDDNVTGNASGSYTFNNYKAEEYLMHNLDLLAEACEEFGGCTDVLKDGAEACDVTIRCYLLGECITDVLDELEEAGFFD